MFFSIDLSVVFSLDHPLNFPIFINSSSIDIRPHFVCLYPKGHNWGHDDDFHALKEKYKTFYALEYDRAFYLSLFFSSPQNQNLDDVSRLSLLKEGMVGQLQGLFSLGEHHDPEIFKSTFASMNALIDVLLKQLENKTLSDLFRMIQSLKVHDCYTFDHSLNVSLYCLMFAKEESSLNLSPLTLGMGGFLHDLGKIFIPTSLLNYPGKLGLEEKRQMEKHPVLGQSLISRYGKNLFEESVSKMVKQHHENLDGSGYPSKLSENEILKETKVLAICDFFDAITTQRSYAKAMSIPQAMALMETFVQKRIDGELFEKFRCLFGVVKWEGRGGKAFHLDLDFDCCRPQL